MVDGEQLLEQRVGSLEKKVDEGFARVNTDIRELRGNVKALDEKLTGKIEKLDEKLTGKIENLDEKLTRKIDQLTIGLVVAVVGAILIDHIL